MSFFWYLRNKKWLEDCETTNCDTKTYFKFLAVEIFRLSCDEFSILTFLTLKSNQSNSMTHFIVIHDCIQWLNPHRVNVTIKHNPLGRITRNIRHISHDDREQSIFPLTSSRVDDSKQLVISHSFRVQIHKDCLLFLLLVHVVQTSQYLRFTSSRVSKDEDRVTHLLQLLQLDDFENETVFCLQFQIGGGLFDDLFEVLISFSRDVHGREQISDETQENRHVIRDDLRHVEITKSSHEDLIFSTTWISSSQGSRNDKHRLDCPQAPIVMVLLRQQLFAKSVERDESSSEKFCFCEGLGNQHDFRNEGEIRHHHSAGSEESFQIFRQLGSTSVPAKEKMIRQLIILHNFFYWNLSSGLSS